MRVVFMGTTPFSCVVLNQLLVDGYDVVGVVTQPDRPFGRKKILKPSVVKEMALEHGIAVLQPEKIKQEIDGILDLKADLIVTCAYGQLVPQKILNAPALGCLNVHASLLPKFRGGAPIHWAIIRGETQTGVTLMHMDVGMDSGDMIAKRAVSIDHLDTMGDVEAKLMNASKTLIHEDLAAFLLGKLASIKQDEAAVSIAYTIKSADELIDFNAPVEAVYNHIRGLIPWPVGYAMLEGKRVKFHGVRVEKSQADTLPGLIVNVDETGVCIQCVGGCVRITKIQPEGKPAVMAADFFNGTQKEWEGKRFL